MSERNQDLIEDVAQNIVIAHRFYIKGETTPPIVPLDQQSEIETRWRNAARSFADTCINLMLQTQTADVICRGYMGKQEPSKDIAEWRHGEIMRDHSGGSITLFRGDEETKPCLLINHYKETNITNPQENQTAENLLAEFIANRKEKEGWTFNVEETVAHPHLDSRNKTYEYHRFKMTASKPLSAEYLTTSEGQFLWFIRGFSNRALDHLISLMKNRTITETDAERLTKVAEICEAAVEQIRQVNNPTT